MSVDSLNIFGSSGLEITSTETESNSVPPLNIRPPPPEDEPPEEELELLLLDELEEPLLDDEEELELPPLDELEEPLLDDEEELELPPLLDELEEPPLLDEPLDDDEELELPLLDELEEPPLLLDDAATQFGVLQAFVVRLWQQGVELKQVNGSFRAQSGTSPEVQNAVLLFMHVGVMQFGTLQISAPSVKQQGISPTPPIHINASGTIQSGISPGAQKLPLLVQAGIIQFGVLLSKVILLMQTGIFAVEPTHLKSSVLVLQSGT